MLNSRTPIMLTAIAASVSVQVWAQQSASPTTSQAAGQPAGLVATTNNPNLAVATVKLENGVRTSKIVGQSVYLDSGDKVGTVDDLIMTGDNKVTVAVLSTGGVLGVGAKLVAVPFEQIRPGTDKVQLPGVSKDDLNAMPSFVY